MRDWPSTLWPTSFRAVPFWVENHEASGGRRIVSHQFPNRDDPFNEDLGSDLRKFEVTAYVASDGADGEADALIAVCDTKTPGPLILPTIGPVNVRCLTWKRSEEKDKLGKIAFTLTFVREGVATALASVLSLANLVFAGASSIEAAVGAVFANAVTVLQQPDFVVSAAISGLQDGAAMLESIRSSQAVDPVVSAAQRNAIQAFYDVVPSSISRSTGADPAIAGQLVTIARALGDGMTPDAAAQAFAEMMDSAVATVAAVYASPSLRQADVNAAAGAQAARLAAITAWAEAIARRDYTDRGQGITARADAAERFESALNEATGALNIDLFDGLTATRDATIAYLSQRITTLAPVITVQANREMPALYWSWRLYQDPLRAGELTARNRVIHPALMPQNFEALAS